jgi:hypothetical protein
MSGLFENGEESEDENQRNRRLYIDTLFKKTRMYANYTPATCLVLGDYGDLTQQGVFIKSGNIFEEYPLLKDEVRLRREDTGSDVHFFASRTRRKNAASIVTV